MNHIRALEKNLPTALLLRNGAVETIQIAKRAKNEAQRGARTRSLEIKSLTLYRLS